MAETAPKIYSAIAGVIADVGAVGKDKVNKQQGFKFRSVDDVYNALHPALAKNKVFIVPDIMEREVEQVTVGKNGTTMYHVTCQIRFTFFAEDGSSIESTIVGEAMDMADKATNKAMAIAYKYACFQVFCIPTEEMLDPDEVSPDKMGDDGKAAGKPAAGAAKRTMPSGDKGTAKADAKGREASKEENPPRQQAADAVPATPEMLQAIDAELARTGVDVETILNLFKVKSLDQLTAANYEKVMKKFNATPDKEVESE